MKLTLVPNAAAGVNASYSSSNGGGNEKLFVKRFTNSPSGLAAELAAYDLAVECGLRVNPTTGETFQGEAVMVQPWVTGRDLWRGDLSRDMLDKVATFDFVVGNADRHGGNFMVTTDGVVLIDHERAFLSNEWFKTRYLDRLDDLEAFTSSPARVNEGVVDSIINAMIGGICNKYPNLDWTAVQSRILHLMQYVEMQYVADIALQL